MKTITLVPYRRLNYLREVVESLKGNNLADYTLFIAVEPDDADVIVFCETLKFMPVHVRVNSTRLGEHWNNKSAYEWAFAHGSEFNVAVEDDTPLSPDALDLANWFFHHSRRNDYLLLNLFNQSRGMERPLDIVETAMMCPWGFCFTRASYEQVIGPNWMSDARGWDWSICACMAAHSLQALMPVLSRSRNIGRLGGTYCTPEFHDQCFIGQVASDRTHGTAFRLCAG